MAYIIKTTEFKYHRSKLTEGDPTEEAVESFPVPEIIIIMMKNF